MLYPAEIFRYISLSYTFITNKSLLIVKVKVKNLYCLLGLQEFEEPRISEQLVYEGGKFLSPTVRPPYLQEIPFVLIFWRMSRLQGHTATGSIKSMKNLNDTIGNRTRDFRACSSVPQRIALPRAPLIVKDLSYFYTMVNTSFSSGGINRTVSYTE